MAIQEWEWDLESAMAERGMMNHPLIGPLTLEQTEQVEAYERFQEEEALEYEAREAAGGRTICPLCGKRTVKHRSVYTLGYEGHPGAEQSDFANCENCPYQAI